MTPHVAKAFFIDTLSFVREGKVIKIVGEVVLPLFLFQFALAVLVIGVTARTKNTAEGERWVTLALGFGVMFLIIYATGIWRRIR